MALRKRKAQNLQKNKNPFLILLSSINKNIFAKVSYTKENTLRAATMAEKLS